MDHSNLSLGLSTPTYFLLDEVFYQDVFVTTSFDLTFYVTPMAELQRFLFVYENYFFKKSHFLFLYLSCLLQCFPFRFSLIFLAVTASFHSTLLSKLILFFLQDQKQGFLFKTGDSVLLPLLSNPRSL